MQGGVIRSASAGSEMQGSAIALEQAAPDVNEEPRQAAGHLQRAMEQYAGRLRDLILSQPPRKLIGYIWARATLGGPDSDAGAAPGADAESAFLLQYVHAVLACHDGDPAAPLSEAACEDIIACAGALHAATRQYCDALAPDGADEARRTEFVAKSSWVSPAHRPEALQEEFLAFVLTPHDEALRQRHGIGAADIIKRLLAISGTMRSVQQRAADAIEAQMADVAALAQERHVGTEEAARLWNDEQPEQAKAAARAYVDLLEGGLCNLSAHTDLPIALLRDLAMTRQRDALLRAGAVLRHAAADPAGAGEAAGQAARRLFRDQFRLPARCRAPRAAVGLA